jgi:hypothetical protein
MGLMKELAELNAIYQKMSTPDVDEAMTLLMLIRKEILLHTRTLKKV